MFSGTYTVLLLNAENKTNILAKQRHSMTILHKFILPLILAFLLNNIQLFRVIFRCVTRFLTILYAIFHNIDAKINI